jgi:hypothetical protein
MSFLVPNPKKLINALLPAMVTRDQLIGATTEGISPPAAVGGVGSVAGLDRPPEAGQRVVAEVFSDLSTPIMTGINVLAEGTDVRDWRYSKNLKKISDKENTQKALDSGLDLVVGGVQDFVVSSNEETVREGLSLLQPASAVTSASKPSEEGRDGFKIKVAKDKSEMTTEVKIDVSKKSGKGKQHVKKPRQAPRFPNQGKQHQGSKPPMTRKQWKQKQKERHAKYMKDHLSTKGNLASSGVGAGEGSIDYRNLTGTDKAFIAAYVAGGVSQAGNLTKFIPVPKMPGSLRVQCKVRLGSIVMKATTGATELKIDGVNDTGGQIYLNPTNTVYMPAATAIAYISKLFDRWYINTCALIFNTALSTADRYQITWCMCESTDHWDRLAVATNATTPSKALITAMSNSATFPAWEPSARIFLMKDQKSPHLYTSTAEGAGGYVDWAKAATMRQCYGGTAGIRVDGATPAADTTIGDLYMALDASFYDMSGYLSAAVGEDRHIRRACAEDQKLDERIQRLLLKRSLGDAFPDFKGTGVRPPRPRPEADDERPPSVVSDYVLADRSKPSSRREGVMEFKEARSMNNY